MEELYKLSARPPIPTSTKVNETDLTWTKEAKFVYVKVDEPSSLAPRFEGPYPIVSRPSRSTIEVRIGSFANGNPRLQVYNWNTCRVAHLREGAEVGQRPQLGRPPKVPQPLPSIQPDTTVPDDVPEPTEPENDATESPVVKSKQNTRGKIQNDETASNSRPVRATRNPHPNYVDSIGFDRYG